MAARRPVFVVGTRAQLIKVAPVVVACRDRGLFPVLLMTGQHRETMDDLLEEFGVDVPRIDAVPGSERASIGSLLRWLPPAHAGLRRCLRELAREGDIDVLVHGDTLSTLLGAWAGRRAGGRVVHLESGLTSGRLLDPFPEELVRRLVFRLAHVAMCPNPETAAHMRRLHRAEVVDTGGNTIVDAVVLARAGGSADAGDGSAYAVASLHRFQNLYDATRLAGLVALVQEVAGTMPVHFVLHPTTRKRLEASGLLTSLVQAPGVHLHPRMGYRAFLGLASGADCVLTDGGSNQEELALLGVPTLVMRERSERSDGLGANAMLEADVPGGVAAFVRDGGHHALRRPSAAGGGLGPSRRIADWLAGG